MSGIADPLQLTQSGCPPQKSFHQRSDEADPAVVETDGHHVRDPGHDVTVTMVTRMLVEDDEREGAAQNPNKPADCS